MSRLKNKIKGTNILSLYLSHDTAATYIDKNNKLKVLEYERFVKQRYGSFTKTMENREGLGTTDLQRRSFLEYIKEDLKGEIKLILHSDPALNNNDEDLNDKELIKEFFPNAKYLLMLHHEAHAASGFYTSNFNDAVILSFDGGGLDIEVDAEEDIEDEKISQTTTYTKVFVGSNNTIKSVGKSNMSLGIPYGHLAKCISEIKAGPDCDENSLVYSGKIMGLCGYGHIKEEWVKPMITYYESGDYYGDKDALYRLGKEIGLDLGINKIKGQVGYDLAATSQYVFEMFASDIIQEVINKERELSGKFKNIILVGGCALNVLFNQSLAKDLKKHNLELYVPAYPNDCGLALGQFLNYTRARVTGDPYIGFDILDRDKFDTYKKERNAKKCDIVKLVDLIKDGKIIGILQGQSEIGPRALGNRSIICDPSIKDMKDILNSKVKFREWYRPFAPVCRLEDSETYFDDVFESKYMSFAPTVKKQYREILPSITHIDGTARLQTVKEEDHKLFYDILTELKKRDEIPVILNTSFNMKGYPILTTIEDALKVLDETEMDYVYVEGYLFTKK